MRLSKISTAAVLLIAFFMAGCQNMAQPAGGASASGTMPVASSEKPYFIEFRSRYALSYGHSFVVFGRMGPGNRVISQEVAGLAPASNDPNVYVAGHVIPVPSSVGATDGDTEKQYMTAYWRVRLSEPEYRKVVSEIRRLQKAHPTWTAVGYNCNAFVGDVAASMGYSKPFHLLRPREYIDSLRRRNAKPGDASWTSPTSAPAGPKGNSV